MALFGVKLTQANGSRMILVVADDRDDAEIFVQRKCGDCESVEFVSPELLVNDEFRGVAELATI